MRAAFVVQLGPETRPEEGRFDGCVEEVDAGIELRFHSGEALLKFMGERFEIAMAATGKASQKPFRKKRKSL
jgi:hypothetical protein